MTLLSTASCLVVLWLNSPERTSVGWFAAFVLAIHCGNVSMIIGFAGAYDRWPGLTFLPVDLAPLLGPLLWLHVRTLMLEPSPRQQYWWLLPGAVYWLYQVWAFTALGDYRAKWAFNDQWHQSYIVPVVFAGSLALGVAALVKSWRLHRRYAQWLARSQGDNLEFRPVWLIHLIVLAGAYGALSAIEYLLDVFLNYDYYDRYWVDFAAMFVIFIIAVEALVNMQRRYPKMPLSAPDELETEEEPDNDTQDQRDWVAEGAKLQTTLRDEGWYLEPGISLAVVAGRMGTNQSYVSRALNKGLAQNFSQLINGLRVQHAQGMIAAGDTSFIDVALSAGFGSKASFNRAFRQHAGMTPSQWKGQQAG